jgi:TrmH RNA methyltransferase
MKKRKDILYYYGLHAVLALFERRKNSIEKVYLKKEHVNKLSKVLKWCADNKKPYNIVEDHDLEKLTDSTHHEGVCFVAKPKDELHEEDFLKIISTKEKSLLLFLNHVENPHNLGAIARTCAHFNIRFILTDVNTSLSPSCCRIAQGGAESITLVKVENAEKTLLELKNLGFTCYGTSSHEGKPLNESSFAKKSVLIMGSETQGIDKKLSPLLDRTISIVGTGYVESLNVSQATALCSYAYFCQHGL